MKKILPSSFFIAAAAVFLTAACSSFQDREQKTVNEEPEISSSWESTEAVNTGRKPGEAPTPESLGLYQTVLLEEAEDLCQPYFKAGDFSYTMNVSAGGRRSRNELQMYFYKKEGDQGSLSNIHHFSLPYTEGTDTYAAFDLYDDLDSGSAARYSISFYGDSSVRLWGYSDADGVYYPCQGNLFMPEAFVRPLNDSDILTLSKEDIQLLRNQFYAVYGRKFATPHLKSYFENKPWYMGLYDGGSFDFSVFSGLEKRNIQFLAAKEDTFDEAQYEENKKAYEKLETAPYASLLPEEGEIFVNLDSDSRKTEDLGLCYAAQGTIFLPVEVTAQEYEDVMKHNGEAEICINELTGQTAVAKLSDNSDYGDCMLLYEDEGEMRTDYYFLEYQPSSNAYTLWTGSDDTFFKPVYEGTVYVLKGAEEEWYHYFSLPSDQRSQAPGAWRKMAFDGDGAPPYTGNAPVFDKKGYLKALYNYGD